jgi:uncharacterized membrane protein YhhN
VNAASVAFLVGAAVAAVTNWIAVSTARKNLEYVTKPATLLLLIGAALSIDAVNDTQRVWFVVALSFSLLGDIALMVPSDRFVLGLASFLLAHVAYAVGMAVRGLEAGGLVVGVVVAVVAVLTLGRRIIGAAPSALRLPVTAYVLVISAMVAFAIGTVEPWIIVGALLFYASDALIGWTRFIADFPRSRVAVMVTYHVGQGALVVGLL